MPVYNGVRFLEDSVHGIAAQDHPDIEFIAVDDGSEDGSYELLLKLTEGMNAKVIRKENGGISSARNMGLDNATGDYILFVDQDDSIPEGYVSGLLKAAQDKDSDLVIGGTLQRQKGKMSARNLAEGERFSLYRNTSPWGRIYSRSLIEGRGIRFMDTRVSEDFYFNIVAITNAVNPQVIKQSGYIWTIDDKSESHSNMSRLEGGRTDDVIRLLDRSVADMNSDKRDINIDYMLLKHCVWYLLFTCKGSSKEDIKDTHSRMISWLEGNVEDYLRCCNMKAGHPRGETFKIRFTVRTAMLMQRMGLLLTFLYLLR